MKKIFKGFTLIELLVVIGIIALLATVGMASYRSVNRRSRDSKRQADLEQVRAALEMYRTDVGVYPTHATGNPLPALGTGYLPNPPSDPLPGNPAYYYSSAGSTYLLCADVENTVTDSCNTGSVDTYDYGVTNP